VEKFSIGDFIRLKNMSKWNTGRILNQEVNAFEINEINDQNIKIKNSNDIIPLSEVEPIPIDGESDLHIFYDPIIAANIISPGEEITVKNRDRKYYYDKFLKCFDGFKNFQKLAEERNCKYVHEVQHLLRDKFQDNGLKIDAF